MRRGFTLIELMIVVAIIGVLAAITIPMYSTLVAKSQEGTTKSNLGTIRSALAIYFGDNEGNYPNDNLISMTASDRYITIIPMANLPRTTNNAGHQPANGVLTGTLPGAVDDVAGGVNTWVYDNTGPTSIKYGQVAVNCTHQDLRGLPWSSY